MPRLSPSQQVLGDAIVERASALDKPTKKSIKDPLAAFLEAHRALTKANDAVEALRSARDEAIAAVASADEVLDDKLQTLADALVGVGLGERRNPFAAFGRYSPSQLCALAYAKELDAARALCAAIGKKKNAPKKQLAETTKAADAVEKALAGLTKPQAAYQKALATREALLLDWQKRFSRLKKIAAGALIDDTPTYRALFAAPTATQAPRTRRKKSKPSPAPSPDAPA